MYTREGDTVLGTFIYHNPTKIMFGEESLDLLENELKSYGPRVLLVYGGGSIKRNGVYDEVIAILKRAGKQVFEDAGVMPNPTLEKLYQGLEIARAHDIDLILAVGGGSVADYAKALSVSIHCENDPWETYFVRFEEPMCEIVPVGVVLTMAGTGSEMNGGSVITNHDQNMKVGHVFGTDVFPRFSVLNPEFTLTVPRYQMVAGIYDTMNHIMEQYFSGDDVSTSDYVMEGLMRSVIDAGRKAANNPHDYEARSNIMWSATWALNTFVAKGKPGDWEIHMLGQAIGAHTDATHGMTLAAVTLPYYRHVMPHAPHKFAQFAQNVFGISGERMSVEEHALAGLRALESWMREIGCVMNSSELGVKPEMIDSIAKSVFILEGGYITLSKDEVEIILRESM